MKKMSISCFVFFLFFILNVNAKFEDAYDNHEYVLDVKFYRVDENSSSDNSAMREAGHEKISADIETVEVLEKTIRKSIEGDTFFFKLMKDSEILYETGAYIHLMAMPSPPIPGQNTRLDSVIMPIQLPYNPKANKIEISSQWETKTFDIGQFTCSQNNICDFGENGITCPNDCNENNDGICVNKIDNFCDPDCFGKDLDCKRDIQNKTEAQDKKEVQDTKEVQDKKEVQDTQVKENENIIKKIIKKIGFIRIILFFALIIAVIAFIIIIKNRSK